MKPLKYSLKPKKTKYKSESTIVDGIRFDSKKEAQFYGELKLRKIAGEVLFFLRQVPIHLPGGIRYVLDFMVFYSDGEVRFIDVKGYETETFKLKKKQVEELYPFDIEII